MQITINNIIVKTDGIGFKFEALIPNPYFGKEEEFLKKGYKKKISKDSWQLNSDFHTLDASCFKNEKRKFLIAYLSYDKREEDYDLHTIGSRVIDLPEKDLKDFMESYKLIMRYVRDRDK